MARKGVPGNELQRQLGLTCKSDWCIGSATRASMIKQVTQAILPADVEFQEARQGGNLVAEIKPGEGGYGTGA